MYPQRQAKKVTYAGYIYDLLHRIAPVMIQYGDEIGSNAILFREGWATLFLGGDCRVKVLNVATINAPSHMFAAF